MRPGLNSKRPRNPRANMRRSSGHHRPHTIDSSGPDVKIRGSASQIVEKYLALARDASTSGDRVRAENYLQHADHYYRVGNPDDSGQRPHPPQSPHPSNGGPPGGEDAKNQVTEAQS